MGYTWDDAKDENNNKEDSSGVVNILRFFVVAAVFYWLWGNLENYSSLSSPYNHFAGWYNYVLREPLIFIFKYFYVAISTVWEFKLTSTNWVNVVFGVFVTLSFVMLNISVFIFIFWFLSEKLGQENFFIIVKGLILVVYFIPFVVFILFVVSSFFIFVHGLLFN